MVGERCRPHSPSRQCPPTRDMRNETVHASAQLLATDHGREQGKHRGCLQGMNRIWEVRPTEVHDLFRRVAVKVLDEVRERPEVVRRLRVVGN